MAHLRIDLPEGEILHHILQPGRTTLGRSSGNDIFISDLALSRYHAAFDFEDDQVSVVDVGSRNGIFVNDSLIKAPVRLRDGDRLRIGSSRILFREEETRAAEKAALESEVITWTEARHGSEDRLLSDTGRQRILQQLDLAREIQRFLLPREAPVVPGYRFAGDTQPCYEVGGDFFDYHLKSDGRLILVVADVARKGLGAALLGHYSQAYMRGAVGHEQSLEDLVGRLNEDIALHSPPNQYLNASFCDLDYASGEFSYVNAGHCPPLLVQPGGGSGFLPGSNLLLGIVGGVVYEASRAVLARGGMLVMYTDGITECMSRSSEEFGPERLQAFMTSRSAVPPEGILRDLEAELESFSGGQRPGDDITLMIVQRPA